MVVREGRGKVVFRTQAFSVPGGRVGAGCWVLGAVCAWYVPAGWRWGALKSKQWRRTVRVLGGFGEEEGGGEGAGQRSAVVSE